MQGHHRRLEMLLQQQENNKNLKQQQQETHKILVAVECTLSLPLPLTMAVGKFCASLLTASLICNASTQKITMR
jgi:hypothetical protein